MHYQCIGGQYCGENMLSKLGPKRHNSKSKKENAVGDVRRITFMHIRFGQLLRFSAQVLLIKLFSLCKFLETLEFFFVCTNAKKVTETGQNPYSLVTQRRKKAEIKTFLIKKLFGQFF